MFSTANNGKKGNLWGDLVSLSVSDTGLVLLQFFLAQAT